MLLNRVKNYILGNIPPKPGTGRLPPKPGTGRIPPGMMRRFTVTSEKNLQSISMHGLKMSYARGFEGPKGIYSWTNFNDAESYAGGAGNMHAIIVEFWDDPKHYAAHRFITFVDVPPSHIIAIHEGWHDSYHYIKEHEMRNTIMQRLRKLQNDPKYKRVLEQLESEGYK